ncbi:unnamed protein product [Microthlaspi erraticum]|uniref:Uncharacterized protein n=1 Tax=Microthlaspi erraticum TaxID=1685480 RepID=A0A6D2JXI2_9BRAS|nr:unnamed protein product [Microthlaspi erraticum]
MAIWMSRKGVITKRVKTVQTALSRISAQTAQSGWPRNMFALGQSHIRPTEVSAKVPNRPADHATTRETLSRGRPSFKRHATPRTTKAREPGNKPRGRATRCVPRPMHPSEPGKNVPRPAEKPSAKSHPPTTPADRESIRPRPFRPADHDPTVRPIVPTDRPNAAVDPKPVLKPISYFQARLNPSRL